MKKILALSLIGCIPAFGFSQQFTGYSYDNYAGVPGVLQNPASVAGSKYKVNVNLFSLSVLGGTNAYELKRDKLVHFDFSGMDEGTDYFKQSNTKKKNLWLNTDIIGPSVMITTGRKSGIALYTRMRSLVNEYNLSDNTFRMFNNGNDALYGTNIQEQNVQMKAHAFAEGGLTYGRIVYNSGQHLVKAGITGKYVVGLGAAAAWSGNMLVNINKTDYINQLSGDANVRYSSNLDDIDNDFSDVFNKTTGNHGIGFDIGLSYEWRPQGSEWLVKDQTPYRVRLNASVTDIGSVKYSNSAHGNSYTVNGVNHYTDDLDKKDGETFDEYFTRLESIGIITTQSKQGDLKVKLPTALRFDADYHIYKRLFINGGTVVSLINNTKNQLSAQYATSFTLTPRLEKKWIGIYSPVYYNKMQEKISWGAGIRLGGLYVGSASLLGNFLSNKNISNTDFHIGLSIPVYQRKRVKHHKEEPVEPVQPVQPQPQPVAEEKKIDTVEKKVEVTHDRDNDGVIDEKDACPDTPGEVALAGCPDKDKDGIADKDDRCPDVPGTAKYGGCPIPDSDNDGINDEEDKCPQVAGVAKYNGCPIPDTDNDGVNDEEDKCPTTPGKPENQGCPEIKKEVVKKVTMAAKSIYFLTGKDIIQKVSYSKLDVVAGVLKSDKDLHISIEGHTDNKGNAAVNQKLSDKRAQAVKNYLVKKGIEESRINAQGFGSTKPIAPNTTAAGRAKNRRVELHLNY